tara:strand:- start:1048 stop:1590 length:543 start_codon:yes stop_codon:yes gene_type:complete
MVFQTFLFCLVLGLFFSGCEHKQDRPLGTNHRPIIYDAWDARYKYQMENRRMTPLHQGRQVGRVWSRDKKGKVNYAAYHSSNKENAEDLFVLHTSQLDRKREKKWENSKEQRINFIQNQMEILKEEENAPLVEVLIEEEDDEFLPPAFIPQGIDLNSVENPVVEESPSDSPPAFPFAPLP